MSIFQKSNWLRLVNMDSRLLPSNKLTTKRDFDLVIADPPFGIDGACADKHYNRDSSKVVQGYVEAPGDYRVFTLTWMAAVKKMVRPGGAIVIFSGRTNLRHILNAAAALRLHELNHIIWKYDFGVYAKTKFVDSHYHILYYTVECGPRTYNTYCRYDAISRDPVTGVRYNYRDREDVWTIPRENKPGEMKTVNQLPEAVVLKVIEYLSNPGDCILDPFVGSGTVPRVAAGVKRRVWGCEISPSLFDFASGRLRETDWGWLQLDRPTESRVPERTGVAWDDDEVRTMVSDYDILRAQGMTKRAAVAQLQAALKRGAFAIQNKLKEVGAW